MKRVVGAEPEATDGVLTGSGDSALTQTGKALGTPAYMSPEQAAGDKALDARTDLYSLGSVLYEMLAGEPPFTGPTAQAIVIKRLTEPPPSVRAARPAVPPAVDEAIRRVLAPVPAPGNHHVEHRHHVEH